MNKHRTRGHSLQGTKGLLQDVWGSRDEFAWVIDGATRQNASENSLVASWANSLSQAIESATTDSPASSLSSILYQAITQASLWPNDGFHPSATIALTRVNSSGAEWLVLGDACAVIRNEQGDCEIHQDDRLEHVASKLRERVLAARAAGNARTAARLGTLLLEREDASRNQESGFWVASDNPDAAWQAQSGFVSDAHVVYLFTDGVCEAIQDSRQDWPHACDAFYGDVTDTLQSLRDEAAERRTRIDDMTAVVHEWIG